VGVGEGVGTAVGLEVGEGVNVGVSVGAGVAVASAVPVGVAGPATGVLFWASASPPVATGMASSWPMLSSARRLRPLACSSSAVVTPKRMAISDGVSPSTTT